MADYVCPQKGREPGEVAVGFQVKQPVAAVCKEVKAAKERTLSYHGVDMAETVSLEYRPVKEVHECEMKLHRLSRPVPGNAVLPQGTDVVCSDEISFDCVQSKKVKNNLTLRELFSGQEGY